ncbi:MAG: hypothetical protein EOO65_02455 [Methanosarcinales archaeon]|nr:MAG: hypothetical protein EOO65_02455 [Methanosarcinales archaeon]
MHGVATQPLVANAVLTRVVQVLAQVRAKHLPRKVRNGTCSFSIYKELVKERIGHGARMSESLRNVPMWLHSSTRSTI